MGNLKKTSRKSIWVRKKILYKQVYGPKTKFANVQWAGKIILARCFLSWHRELYYFRHRDFFFWGGEGGGAYFTKVLLIFLLKANTILFVSCTFLYKNWTKLIAELKEINAFRVLSTILDCKKVGFFFSKSVKKSVKRGIRVEPHTPVLASLALDFQPRSRPFVWLLARTWIRKNTDYFAVYNNPKYAPRSLPVPVFSPNSKWQLVLWTMFYVFPKSRKPTFSTYPPQILQSVGGRKKVSCKCIHQEKQAWWMKGLKIISCIRQITQTPSPSQK